MGRHQPMIDPIGIDRTIQLDWLDLVASRYGETHSVKTAFDDTRVVVGATVGGGASHHNATGKTMTVLARVWLRVPPEVAPLRDRAAALLPVLAPGDRLAIHWCMCELAYPFHLHAAGIVGRALALGDSVTLVAVRSRLADRWGARGTLRAASQRLLQTWVRWGVLMPMADGGTFAAAPRRAVTERAGRLVAEIRVLADPMKTMDLGDLQRAPDLFPLELPNLRPLLADSGAVQISRESGSRYVVRAMPENGDRTGRRIVTAQIPEREGEPVSG